MVLCLVPGCVRFEAATIGDQSTFAPLEARDLPAFEQQLALERQTGAEDAWTRLGIAWLDLINCLPMPAEDAAPFAGISEPDPTALFLYHTVRLEHLRRARLLHQKGAGYRTRSISGTLLGELDDKGFFERKATAHGADVVWPPLSERWPDELPAQLDQPSLCQELYTRHLTQGQQERLALEQERAFLIKQYGKDMARTMSVRVRLGMRPDLPPAPGDNLLVDPRATPPPTLAALERQELEQITRTVAAAKRISPAPQAVLRTLWRVRYHGLVSAWEHGGGLRELDQPGKKERELAALWDAIALEHAEELAELDLLLPREISEEDQMASLLGLPLLYLGWQRAGQGEHEQALGLFERAQRRGVGGENEWALRYGKLAMWQRLGRWEQARGLSTSEIPPRSHPLHSAYIWRLGQGLWQGGERDRFMALALGTFRDTPYEADPFLRALYLRMLRLVVQPAFEPRVLELLEDLGPRSRTFERVEEYAAVALDEGRGQNAAAAARWLLAKHSNARYHPRYWSLVALAAFLEDDLPGFDQAIKAMTERQESLKEALGRQRQATFFASADAQLATVFRTMLPLIAQWGESPGAVALRQKWIESITSKVSAFVKQTPESLARPVLTELYRLASAMLQAGTPRAYPEQVGQTEPLPLVLGVVKVSDRDLDPYEPVVSIFMPQIDSMTLVPEDRPLPAWLPRWRRPLDPPRTKETR